ncbi:class IIb bacteriocin, lactobin A/cerein 7B family [Sphingobacterium siyangense]|jgi:lactobin A/cerein 7B family class IIb bacteriocin|uniref:class IIb bacteriocin, lactobin A/cerein 7B family n=1 Tax=Sphingobacterium siyangense TaxID=459529 RepID=UPI000E75FCA7|nr:class IIb bacteriocin, lactobin A/cerein 7B family [Sphingobacterium siyangense]
MNTLDLKGFGVQEMDAKEMEVVDGGLAPLVYVGAMAVGYLIGVGIRLYAAS